MPQDAEYHRRNHRREGPPVDETRSETESARGIDAIH